jgi:putative metalloprotease
MIRFLPILLALAYAGVMLALSAWRTQKMLAQRSSPVTETRLLAEMAPLARALQVPAIALRVFEMPGVNALAAPDGQVYLTRGMVKAWAAGQITGPEIASVVAHELGHLSLGHLRRRMIDFTGQNAVFVVLTALLSRWLPFLGVWIANLLTSAVMARLSRRDEFEADEFAAALMIKAGLGTGPQRRLLAKLGDLSGNPGVTPDWLMSHPPIPDRIAAIEHAEARWNSPAL